MWIATTRGFYSAVQDRGDPTRVLVRARNEKDIRNLKDLLDAEPWKADDSDYAWRLSCTVAEWAETLAKLALEIDYDNFKNAVAEVSPMHASVYHKVWGALLGLSPTGQPNYAKWSGWSGGGGLFPEEKIDTDRLTAKGLTPAQIAATLGGGVTTKMVRGYLNGKKRDKKAKGKHRKAGTRTKPKAGAKS